MYKQLSKEDRRAIDYYIRCQWTHNQIARVLNRNRSVISREIGRNSDADGIYRYGSAHKKYLERRHIIKQGQRKIENDIYLQVYIEKRLLLNDSPEQIAGRLRTLYRKPIICHETIYRWVYTHRPDLCLCLCYKKTKYRRKRGTKKRDKKRRINQFRSIDERPLIVEQKKRLGDFEGDTIIGKRKKQRILTHTDRFSGYGFANLLSIVSSNIIENTTVKIFKRIPRYKRHTITYDRGTEFGGDDTCLERKIKTNIYRAHPYHSWERGCNENFNGLIRRFFPKGTDFSILNQADIDRVINILNHRPRKRLNYLTPYEVFIRELDPVAVQIRM